MFVPPPGPQGPDIVETSTEMIHSSELHKISKGHSQERHFFLFDKQLIYCKKVSINIAHCIQCVCHDRLL